MAFEQGILANSIATAIYDIHFYILIHYIYIIYIHIYIYIFILLVFLSDFYQQGAKTCAYFVRWKFVVEIPQVAYFYSSTSMNP